jgi:hypothetical protein
MTVLDEVGVDSAIFTSPAPLTTGRLKFGFSVAPIPAFSRTYYLLRTPTTTKPTPATNESTLRIGEMGKVFFCSCDT